ncbi:hypothetical protein [Methylogaea oryzae]|uniref:Uncharacterized protein n=1 Tax=Methylogaea oryzae TaxID=1295382 RepID=A0A8D5AKS2_9GAMM|nr:hypothetical protein [Methylogaea oryzae]BBL72104.1 hypothetical protein MoryE10_27100 [Methylogaea oryzae]
MSYKIGLIKMAIKWTPKAMVLLGANVVLRGIAKLLDFNLDLDGRKAYAKVRLHGEAEIIEVLLEDFAIISDGQTHRIKLGKAQANRPWLNNLLRHVTRKTWKIPTMPEFKAQIEFAAELLKAER